MTEQFIHIWEREFGGVTLALLDEGDHMVSVGAAFCSPNEKSFSKSKGRQIALGRLEARRHGYVAYELGGDVTLRNLHEHPGVIYTILDHLQAAAYRRGREGGPLWWAAFLNEYKRGNVLPMRTRRPRRV